jgi:hypothetical protein
MGVLDNPRGPDVPEVERLANQLKQQARSTYQQLLNSFIQGSKAFWAHPRLKPAEIAAALGTDGKEVFELHGKVGALLATIKPEAVLPGTQVVGQFSYNADGSVTVVDPPATNG